MIIGVLSACVVVGAVYVVQEKQSIIVSQKEKIRSQVGTIKELKAVRMLRSEVQQELNESFQLVGFLKDVNNSDMNEIISLFGKRNKANQWNYYATNNHGIKLEIYNIQEKNCTKERYGCQELLNGNMVKLTLSDTIYEVVLYET